MQTDQLLKSKGLPRDVRQMIFDSLRRAKFCLRIQLLEEIFHPVKTNKSNSIQHRFPCYCAYNDQFNHTISFCNWTGEPRLYRLEYIITLYTLGQTQYRSCMFINLGQPDVYEFYHRRAYTENDYRDIDQPLFPPVKGDDDYTPIDTPSKKPKFNYLNPRYLEYNYAAQPGLPHSPKSTQPDLQHSPVCGEIDKPLRRNR